MKISGFYNDLWQKTLRFRKEISKTISGTILYTGILVICILVYDMGFGQKESEEALLHSFYEAVKWILIISFSARNLLNVFNRNKTFSVKILDGLILVSLIFLLRIFNANSSLHYLLEYIPSYKYLLGPIFLIIFFIEYSRNAVGFYSKKLNPALIFILSFFFIIIIGAFFLSLPNATHGKISLVDALFTSTSAVCVTGLVVLDTSKDFTGLGQIVILTLIQIGGLGIMTFAGFVGFMFSGGGVSFQQRMMLKDIGNSEKLNDVINSIYKIIFIMILVESIGALFIYISTSADLFSSWTSHVFFSVFHSISAFCNAGFSTFPEGTYNVDLRFNNPLLLTISGLIIFGGIGFPIVLNFYQYIKVQALNIWYFVFTKRRFEHVPYILNLNSKIVLITTLSLILVGFVSFFIFEYNGVLREHDLWGKICTSIFSSIVPRTAGFNSVNMSLLSFPTVILMVFLMWVGASPGGTGGGIKTTTFAIMLMNFISMAKGEKTLIIQKREIKSIAINRAFAIVMLSLLLTGFATSMILYFDPQFYLDQIVFEVFSAFSTTGLSLGVTSSLSDSSKLVLIFVMFVGRVGTVTFLSAFIFRVTKRKLKYPIHEVKF